LLGGITAGRNCNASWFSAASNGRLLNPSSPVWPKPAISTITVLPEDGPNQQLNPADVSVPD
jgi:hypothetical protein